MYVSWYDAIDTMHVNVLTWQTLSALLALCEGNPLVTGGFPSQIHRSPVVDLSHKGLAMRALVFSSILVETNYWETPWDSLHWNGSESIWHRLPCLNNDTHIVRLRKDPCSGTSLESSLHNDCWWPGAYLATGHLQISSWCKPSGTHQGYPDANAT